jgi:hypothetical protein
MCKLYAKIEWKKLGDLGPEETQEFYIGKIRAFIGMASRQGG